jgi:hypothetical protein
MMDDVALEIGRVVIGGALFAGWFAAGIKAADSGHNVLAWIIGLTPPVLFVLGLAGAFR